MWWWWFCPAAVAVISFFTSFSCPLSVLLLLLLLLLLHLLFHSFSLCLSSFLLVPLFLFRWAVFFVREFSCKWLPFLPVGALLVITFGTYHCAALFYSFMNALCFRPLAMFFFSMEFSECFCTQFLNLNCRMIHGNFSSIHCKLNSFHENKNTTNRTCCHCHHYYNNDDDGHYLLSLLILLYLFLLSTFFWISTFSFINQSHWWCSLELLALLSLSRSISALCLSTSAHWLAGKRAEWPFHRALLEWVIRDESKIVNVWERERERDRWRASRLRCVTSFIQSCTTICLPRERNSPPSNRICCRPCTETCILTKNAFFHSPEKHAPFNTNTLTEHQQKEKRQRRRQSQFYCFQQIHKPIAIRLCVPLAIKTDDHVRWESF